MTNRRVTEFVGVSTDPRGGVRTGVGPYEFFTDGGVRVSLHDADFLGLMWLPGATARFYFVYDSEWTPSEAKESPVIELTFSQVQVFLWETDSAALRDTEWHGQVSGFAWDGRDGFDLSTFTLHLSFSAARMEAGLLVEAPSGLS